MVASAAHTREANPNSSPFARVPSVIARESIRTTLYIIMMNGNTEQPAAMGNREDEVTLLVGMGFERKKAKRAMEANNGLIDQAIIDLTSGVTFDAPQTTSRRDTMGSDAGLNSLPVPQRRLEPDEDERHRSHRERKSKKKKRRRREHTGERGISTTSDSTPSPATATRDFMEPPASPSRQPFNARMISQFDATSPGHRPAAPRRFGSMGNASLNAPSSQQSKFRHVLRNNPVFISHD